MGLASVVGGERAWWAAELDVEVDAEGEGEEALNDSLGESGVVLARWSSRRIWRLRLENSDSITSRMRAWRSRLVDGDRAGVCRG